MTKRILKYSFIFVLITALFSCRGYQHLLKSSDYELKYKMALVYYNKGDYSRALPLLEELMTIMRGTARAENIHYYYAKANYEQGDYLLASYHFKDFAKTYPHSEHAEECTYLSAYCFYLTSSPYSLDQANTISAIEEMQLFITLYPTSTRITECNEIIDKLRGKLEQKSFEICKQYYFRNEYKASMVSFGNMLKDFPDSKYREEATYLQLKSSYLLTINSYEEKKPDRLKATVNYYNKFRDNFPKSKYLSASESINANCQRMADKMKINLTSN